MDCARGIVQSGIKEVVVDKKWVTNNLKKFGKRDRRTIEMFDEVGVALRKYEPAYVEIKKINDGIDYPFI